jgi:hypothetical protein
VVLARVWYELFAHEAEQLDVHPDADPAGLGRQLRLEMAHSSRVFVAWTWGPGGDDYHVGIGPESFCTDAPEADREVSAWPLWSPLVGKRVELSYVGDERPVLEVRAGGAAVSCCSFSRGMWGIYELRVGSRLPGQGYQGTS